MRKDKRVPVPIVIKSPEDIEKMRAASTLVAKVHERLKREIKPGVKTAELDRIAREMIEAAGATPSFLGYHGYPAAICTSIDDELVHGIPGDHALEEGQIISIDVGAYLDGFHGDAAATYPVGKVSDEKAELIAAAEGCFWAGFEHVRAGNRIGDVSAAIQAYAESREYGVIREYGGHGVGRRMHEDPSILNFGLPGTGARLQSGMILAIEPMISLGSFETRQLEDGWTVVMADGSASAHYEHTVLVTDGDPEVLTNSS